MRVVFIIFVSILTCQGIRFPIDEKFDYLPEPKDLALVLGEEEFEDYLEFWLQRKYKNDFVQLNKDTRAGCSFSIWDELSEPMPIYVSNKKLLNPSDIYGAFKFNPKEAITVNCGANTTLNHPQISQTLNEGKLFCEDGSSFSGPGWLSGTADLKDVTCFHHVNAVEIETGSCAEGTGMFINISFPVESTLHTFIRACFNKAGAEALYVEYEQNAVHLYHQPNVERPSFQQNVWYPGLRVDSLYTRSSQKKAIDSVLGSGMSDKYIDDAFFLARGHLAAKSDFVLSPLQRNTFTFINVAPQWQPFNAGNWNTLEYNLRNHIARLGINTTIYTGTQGVLTLKDSSGKEQEIYLSPSNKKLPVPMWFYKVAYEKKTKRGTVFLGLNNPHVTLEEAKALAFCEDVCENNENFGWLPWANQDIGSGFSICCAVDDFRKTVKTLPAFTVDGLLF